MRTRMAIYTYDGRWRPRTLLILVLWLALHVLSDSASANCDNNCEVCDETINSCLACEDGYYQKPVTTATETTTTSTTTTTTTTTLNTTESSNTTVGNSSTEAPWAPESRTIVYECASCADEIINCTSCSLVNDVVNCSQCQEGSHLSDNKCETCPDGGCLGGDSSDIGLIVGCAVGGVVLIVILVVLGICIYRRLQKKSPKRPAMPPAISDLPGHNVTPSEQDTADSPSSDHQSPTYENVALTKPSVKDIEHNHEKVTRYTRDPTLSPGVEPESVEIEGLRPPHREPVPIPEEGTNEIYENGKFPISKYKTSGQHGHNNNAYTHERHDDDDVKKQNDPNYINIEHLVGTANADAKEPQDQYENHRGQASNYENAPSWLQNPVASPSLPNLSLSKLEVPDRGGRHAMSQIVEPVTSLSKSDYVNLPSQEQQQQQQDDESDEDYYNMMHDGGGHKIYQNPRLHYQR